MKLRYRILGNIFHGAARLPFGVLYAIADVLFFIIYHIVRYRRKVVDSNLAESFPGAPEEERRKIARQFYRNFADYIVETLKLAHVTDDEMRSRMVFEGTDIIDRLFDEGKSIVCYFSHTFNWEWAPSITLWTRHKPETDAVFAQVYRPLRNEFFDRYFLTLRSRFGSRSFPKSSVLRDLIRLRRDNKLSITGFMSDQKPSHGDLIHVVKFLNHPTAIITGTEQLARRMEMAAIYWDTEKLGRGRYRITTRLLTENAALLPPMELTDAYAAMLETTIRRNPSIWLWTHKRWKYPVTFADDNSVHGKSASK